MSSRNKKNIFFHTDFNLDCLLQLAKRLRCRPCTCDDSQIPKSGALNWAISLEFDDGLEWVFRAPHISYGAAQGIVGQLLASEAATLRYIRQHTSIPVPEVFDYSSTYENDIGIPYILMSKAIGHPLARYGWQTYATSERHESAIVDRLLTEREKIKIMRQLGTYARQLYGLRFPAIGSLFDGNEGYHIGVCLSPGHVLHDRETLVEIQRSPFDNEADYYLSLVNALRIHAEQLLMGHHILRAPVPTRQEYPNFAKYYAATDRWNDYAALGGMVESSSNRLQYCITSQLIQERVIPCLVEPGRQAYAGFPLFHHDISLQNLFVDEELNMTCVIDWAFAPTVPPAQLLAPPGLPHPRDLVLDPLLINAYRDGFETEGNTTRDIVNSTSWKVGQMISRFMRLVNLDALQDYEHLKALCALAWSSEDVEEDEDDCNGLLAELAERNATAHALELAKDLAADDEPASCVLRRERHYFNAVGAIRLACARKVALAANMNPRFVADGRLWRWIDSVMEEHDEVQPFRSVE